MAETKEKRYVSDNAQLMDEWDWENNADIYPSQLSLGSHKKVWWKCNRGHKWQAETKSRNIGNGCPYCSGRHAIEGVNDLLSVNPNLAKEWNYERNGQLTPAEVLPNSNKKAWWKCKNGHEWEAIISSRNNGRGCPYCSRKKVVLGYNDLQTVNPALASEWNCERNGELEQENFSASSHKKVWWKCNKGHEWQASIANRSKGRGCPICNSERNTSFPEYAIMYYLKKHGLKMLHSYKGFGYELDVYIPTKKIAIEYDGYYWHKNKSKKDLEKNLKCQKDGIKLYRIREGLPSLNDSSIDFVVKENQKNLAQVLEMLLKEIVDTSVDVDLKRDSIDIENLREHTEKEKSLFLSNPEIAKEWNYERNGGIKPEHFFANSRKKVWWKCKSGHEWEAALYSRNAGRGCPYCLGKKVMAGYNDLQTINPSLANEWNYERNDGLAPEDVLPNSNKKAWWKCKNGHEWEASIYSRNAGRGCPYCYQERRKQ